MRLEKVFPTCVVIFSLLSALTFADLDWRKAVAWSCVAILGFVSTW